MASEQLQTPARALPQQPWPEHVHDDSCPSGVCGSDVPPLIGSTLTGTGLTLDAAADRLVEGHGLPKMTDVQRRLVEQHAEQRLHG